MKSKLLVLVGALVLGIAAMAPAAQAKTVTLQNILGPIETGSQIELRSQNGVQLQYYTSGTVDCTEFSLKAELSENQSDPATMSSVTGSLSASYFTPHGACALGSFYSSTYDKVGGTGDLVLNADGTGEVPIQFTEHRAQWQGGEWVCTYSGTLPLTWTNHSESVQSQPSDWLKGEGVCATPYIRFSTGHSFGLFDSEGEPFELVAE